MSTPANLALADGGPDITADPNSPQASEFTLVNTNLNENDDKAIQQEKLVVKKFWGRFKKNRGYDKGMRRQMSVDRRYASGRAQAAWAVSTNVIGSMIDILCAALYVKDPDVSISKSPQVDESNTRDMELFAQTLEIVVSKLWKSGRLKARMRRVIRSILAVGQGWLKVVMVGEMKPDPVMRNAMNSLEDNLKRVQLLQQNLADGLNDDGSPMSEEDLAVSESTLNAQIEEMSKKLEVMVYQGLAIDFVKADDIQVSTDVAVLEEYLDADTVYHVIYWPKDDAKARFELLTDEALKAAKCYYRRPQRKVDTSDDSLMDGAAASSEGDRTTDDGEEYTTNEGAEKSSAYIRVVEAWDRRDGHVYTGVDNVETWAVAPYTPAYPSERFYPFFYFSIYEVDDERAPQSLAGREAKLQDEYSSVRSNYRISRERSIPGTIFNATQLSDEEAKKFAANSRDEFIPVKPLQPDTPMQNLFMAKPVESIDPRLYETQPILADMERMAGVQEAQTAAITVEKTATEADIQQAGFSARTEAARDNIELVLTDLAQYTVECAIQCLTTQVVQRMAGMTAFWPQGMAKEDLYTLVEVSIEAGTTGKPKKKTDQAAWGTVLPMIQALQNEIAQLYAQGGTNPLLMQMAQPVIDAKKELLKQTMLIAGVDTDLERFLPSPPQPLAPQAMMAPPPIDGVAPPPGGGAPAAPSLPPGASDAGLVPPPGPITP